MNANPHRTPRNDLTAEGRDRDQGLWRVAISGSHGMIGRTLVTLLTTAGHGVTRLVRHAAAAGEVAWSPTSEHFDATALDGIDGVVHLAASNIAAGRWTPSRKQLLQDSRVRATRSLVGGSGADGAAAESVGERVRDRLVWRSRCGALGRTQLPGYGIPG